MKDDDFVAKFVEAAIRKNINDIMKLYGNVPDELSFTFLVAMRVTLDGLLTTLDGDDRKLYDKILNGSETVVVRLPKRKEEET